jgi:cyclase
LVDLVRRTAEAVTIPFTVGGGISGVEGITALLRAGADKVSLNSAAVRDPDLVSRGAERFGCQCIVVAIDARRRQGRPGWDVYVKGGRENTGLDAVAWARPLTCRWAIKMQLLCAATLMRWKHAWPMRRAPMKLWWPLS